MQKRDKNIIIFSIFIMLFLLVWTLSNYNKVQKENEVKKLEYENSQAQQDESSDDSENEEPTKKESEIPIISATDLQSKLHEKNVVIIDMRSEDEFEKKHIQGSFLINDFDLSSIADNTIVFVTNNGNEKVLLNYYRDLSDTNTVLNLQNGFNSWLSEGFSCISLDILENFENNSKINFVEPRDLNAVITNKETHDKIIIVDTRRAGNYQKSHVKDAVNIPFEELEHRYKEISTTKKIYVYGQDSETSFKSGVLMYDLGLIGTKTINGGFDAWQKFEYPTETN